MKFEKLSTSFGASCSFLAGLLLLIQKFAPSKIYNNNIDFIIVVLKNGIFELFILLLIGILFLLSEKIKDKLKKDKRKSIYLGVCIVLILMVNIVNLKNVVKARLYHYKHIDRAYKYSLYNNVCNDLNEIGFHSAIKKIERIEYIYPEEKLILGRFKKSLIGRIEYSQKLFPLTDCDIKEINSYGDTLINKKKLLRLITAFSMFPHERYERKIKEAYDFLNLKLNDLKLNYEKIYSANLTDEFIQKNWFAFDPEILRVLKYDRIDRELYFSNYIKNNDEQSICEIARLNWLIPLIEKQLKWRSRLDFKVQRENYW